MDIKELLKFSTSQKASDLHILPGMPPLMRVYGNLTTMANQPPLSAEDTKNLLFALLTESQIKWFEDKLVVEMPVDLEGPVAKAFNSGE